MLSKSFTTSFCLLFLIYSSFAQEISFSSPEILFEHPAESGFGEDFPFIPFDYNGDNITDFIGGTYADNGQYLYKGTASGNFEDVFFEIGFQRPLMTLDFDGDGDLDIIFEHAIQINNSDDTFESIDALQNNDLAIYGAADFNNDGLIDLISFDVNWPDPNDLHIHYNLGGNNFDDTVIYSGEDTVGDFEVEDIDGDGWTDIAFIFRNGEEFPAIILYNKQTSFETLTLTDELDHDEATLKFVDLDNDNDLDMAAPGDWNDLLILENQDNFYTDDQVVEIEFDKLHYFDFADLDNDGDLDLVGHATDVSTSTFSLYSLTNLGNLNFGPPVKIADFDKPNVWGLPLNKVYANNTLSLYDYDGDNRIDVIYTDGYGDIPAVYLMKNETEVMSNITSINTSSEIIIQPIPASDFIELKGIKDNSNYSIFSVKGQLIQTGNLKGNKVPIYNIEPNLYFIIVDGYGATKFIKY